VCFVRICYLVLVVEIHFCGSLVLIVIVFVLVQFSNYFDLILMKFWIKHIFFNFSVHNQH